MKVRRKNQQAFSARAAAPQEPHVTRHHRKSRRLKAGLITLIGVLIIVVGGLAWWLIQGQKKPEQASKALQEVLQVQQASENLKTVKSKLGFAIKYYEPMIFGTGYVLTSPTDSQRVSGADLAGSDNSYSVIALEDKDPEAPTDALDPDFDIRTTNLTVSTSALKDFFAKRKQEYGNLSDIDLTIKHFSPKEVKNKQYTLEKEEEVTLNGVKYKKRSYSIIDNEFAPTPDGGEIQYITVQNSRPYVFKLRYYSFTAPQKMTLFEDVVKSTAYYPLSNDAQVLGAQTDENAVASHGVLADIATDQALPSNSANIPYSLESRTVLEVVAKNQLAVVRIGAIDCKDFDLLLPDGSVGMTAKDACSAATGTGSFVSEDGYVSTNGHVVKHGFALPLQVYMASAASVKNYEPFRQYIRYLLSSGIVTQPQMDSLLDAIDAGSSAAISKLLALSELIPKERFKLGAESNQYAIQLSDEPIKLVQDGTKFSFKYSNEVVAAKFVDMNYDQYVPLAKRDPKVSDVSILKVDQGKYPVARIGSFTNISNGALITSIGFPGFVDGGLETTKERTVPSVTQGTVKAIKNDGASPLMLAATSVPGAQGSSGGPNFSEGGLSVGLTTYGGSPNDPEAGVTRFGPGTMRNMADFSDLVAKNNITLDTTSSISETWNQAIDRFAKAHYKAAIPLFEQVKQQYSAQYLVPAFIETAQAKIANGEDRTPNNTLFLILVLSLALVVVGIIVIVFIIVRHNKQAPTSPEASAQPVQPPLPPPPPPLPSQTPSQPILQQQSTPTMEPILAPQPVPTPPTPPTPPPPPPPAPPAPHTVIEPQPTVELEIPHDQNQ